MKVIRIRKEGRAMRKDRRLSQWDVTATSGSDVLGIGVCWGDMAGKVKTNQIGFVRQKTVAKTRSKVSGKVAPKAGNKTTKF